MRRKNRRYFAIAVALYLFILWSAFHWGQSQRPADGNIFLHIEHEGIKRLAAEKAQAALQRAPRVPTGELRLIAAGPAFVAARYDGTHVVFMVTSNTESRFTASITAGANAMRAGGTPTRLPLPDRLYAPLAGLQELYAPDSQSLHFFPKIVQETAPGDTWSMNLSGNITIPVVIERTVIAPVGCSLAIGFLATVPEEYLAALNDSREEYFVVRRATVPQVESPQASPVAELAEWKASPGAADKIEELLYAQMREEVAKISAQLVANESSPGESANNFPGGARPQIREWLHADQGLLRGEGHLSYDVRAFQLSPDRVPRLFIRARWTLAGVNAFLMTVWLRADEPLRLLSADTHWSSALRNGVGLPLNADLDFQSVLNEFDADRDGWAELLVHSTDGNSSSIALYLYTDLGPVLLKTPLRRDVQAPESCLER
jgi:hypothetical protein